MELDFEEKSSFGFEAQTVSIALLSQLCAGVAEGCAGADFISLLLTAKAEPNLCFDGPTPLQACVEGERLDIAKLLIDARADPDLAGAGIQTPLTIACSLEHASLVELLIDARADVSSRRTFKYIDDDGEEIATRTPLQSGRRERKDYTDAPRRRRQRRAGGRTLELHA